MNCLVFLPSDSSHGDEKVSISLFQLGPSSTKLFMNYLINLSFIFRRKTEELVLKTVKGKTMPIFVNEFSYVNNVKVISVYVNKKGAKNVFIV